MRRPIAVRGALAGSAVVVAVPTVAVLALAAFAACGSSSASERPEQTRPPSTAGVAGAPEGAGPGESGPGEGTADAGVARQVATGLDVPWGVGFLPDGRALVSERDSGRILLLSAAGGTPTEVIRLPDVVHRSESGLLGLAVSPEYADDRLVYAYYTTASDNRIVRFRMGEDCRAEPGLEPVLTGLPAAPNHDGGRIAFGPDGFLYAAVGDAQMPASAQDPNSLGGKILRMRPDGAVPSDNPTPGSLVYSLGHRNVQGIAWDSAGRLWASEFGQNSWDEINLIRPGANYGWPEVEGVGGENADGGRFVDPLVTWTTDEASPSGIAIRGSVLYAAALRGERLWMVDLEGAGVVGEPRATLIGELGRLRTVVTAPDGTLWLTTSNTDGRGNPRAGDDRIMALS